MAGPPAGPLGPEAAQAAAAAAAAGTTATATATASKGGLLYLPAATIAAAVAAATLGPPLPFYKPPPAPRGSQTAAATTTTTATTAATTTTATAASEASEAAASEAEENPQSIHKSLELFNTSLPSLCRSLVEDGLAAGFASLCVTPAVTLIDRAIVVASAGHSGVLHCLNEGAIAAARHPIVFLRSQPFFAVFAVYLGTFFAANSAETLSAACGANAAPARFITTTACNIGLCVRKDVLFSRLFGGPLPPSTPRHGKTGSSSTTDTRKKSGVWGGSSCSGLSILSEIGRGTSPRGSKGKPFPRTSVALFLARDGFTIAAAFNAPPYFAAYITRWARGGGAQEKAVVEAAPLWSRGAPPTTFGASCLEASTTTSKRLQGGGTTQPHDTLDRQQQQQQQQQEQQEEEDDGVLIERGQLRTNGVAGFIPTPSLASSGEGPSSTLLLLLQERLRGDPEIVLFLSHLLSPVLIQFVSTPLHLLALDLYNRPPALAAQRLTWIAASYFPSLFARAARIIPAFGIGGFVNTKTRTAFSAFDPKP
ncbi:hypothetical protein ACSSS7_002787 [Eimeria intestinalis]